MFKNKYSEMSLEEKRKLYVCGNAYVCLSDIPLWPVLYKKVKAPIPAPQQRVRTPTANSHKNNSSSPPPNKIRAAKARQVAQRRPCDDNQIIPPHTNGNDTLSTTATTATSEQEPKESVTEETPPVQTCAEKSLREDMINEEINNKISLWQGDITRLEIDAIVHASNTSLRDRGGENGTLYKIAGPTLLKECLALNGCAIGEAKITSGHKLPAKYVIHTAGPIGKTHASLLQRCYESCLQLVLDYNLKSIAFCCISTGLHGYPNRDAAEIALKTVRKWLLRHSDKVDRVILCTFLSRDFQIYQRLMANKYFPCECNMRERIPESTLLEENKENLSEESFNKSDVEQLNKVRSKDDNDIVKKKKSVKLRRLASARRSTVSSENKKINYRDLQNKFGREERPCSRNRERSVEKKCSTRRTANKRITPQTDTNDSSDDEGIIEDVAPKGGTTDTSDDSKPICEVDFLEDDISECDGYMDDSSNRNIIGKSSSKVEYSSVPLVNGNCFGMDRHDLRNGRDEELSDSAVEKDDFEMTSVDNGNNAIIENDDVGDKIGDKSTTQQNLRTEYSANHILHDHARDRIEIDIDIVGIPTTYSRDRLDSDTEINHMNLADELNDIFNNEMEEYPDSLTDDPTNSLSQRGDIEADYDSRTIHEIDHCAEESHSNTASYRDNHIITENNIKAHNSDKISSLEIDVINSASSDYTNAFSRTETMVVSSSKPENIPNKMEIETPNSSDNHYEPIDPVIESNVVSENVDEESVDKLYKEPTIGDNDENNHVFSVFQAQSVSSRNDNKHNLNGIDSAGATSDTTKDSHILAITEPNTVLLSFDNRHASNEFDIDVVASNDNEYVYSSRVNETGMLPDNEKEHSSHRIEREATFANHYKGEHYCPISEKDVSNDNEKKYVAKGIEREATFASDYKDNYSCSLTETVVVSDNMKEYASYGIEPVTKFANGYVDERSSSIQEMEVVPGIDSILSLDGIETKAKNENNYLIPNTEENGLCSDKEIHDTWKTNGQDITSSIGYHDQDIFPINGTSSDDSGNTPNREGEMQNNSSDYEHNENYHSHHNEEESINENGYSSYGNDVEPYSFCDQKDNDVQPITEINAISEFERENASNEIERQSTHTSDSLTDQTDGNEYGTISDRTNEEPTIISDDKDDHISCNAIEQTSTDEYPQVLASNDGNDNCISSSTETTVMADIDNGYDSTGIETGEINSNGCEDRDSNIIVEITDNTGDISNNIDSEFTPSNDNEPEQTLSTDQMEPTSNGIETEQSHSSVYKDRDIYPILETNGISCDENGYACHGSEADVTNDCDNDLTIKETDPDVTNASDSERIIKETDADVTIDCDDELAIKEKNMMSDDKHSSNENGADVVKTNGYNGHSDPEANALAENDNENVLNGIETESLDDNEKENVDPITESNEVDGCQEDNVSNGIETEDTKSSIYTDRYIYPIPETNGESGNEKEYTPDEIEIESSNGSKDSEMQEEPEMNGMSGSDDKHISNGVVSEASTSNGYKHGKLYPIDETNAISSDVTKPYSNGIDTKTSISNGHDDKITYDAMEKTCNGHKTTEMASNGFKDDQINPINDTSVLAKDSTKYNLDKTDTKPFSYDDYKDKRSYSTVETSAVSSLTNGYSSHKSDTTSNSYNGYKDKYNYTSTKSSVLSGKTNGHDTETSISNGYKDKLSPTISETSTLSSNMNKYSASSIDTKASTYNDYKDRRSYSYSDTSISSSITNGYGLKSDTHTTTYGDYKDRYSYSPAKTSSVYSYTNGYIPSNTNTKSYSDYKDRYSYSTMDTSALSSTASRYTSSGISRVGSSYSDYKEKRSYSITDTSSVSSSLSGKWSSSSGDSSLSRYDYRSRSDDYGRYKYSSYKYSSSSRIQDVLQKYDSSSKHY